MMILDEVVRRIEQKQNRKRIKLSFAIDGQDADTFLEAYRTTVKNQALSQGQFASRILVLALEREMGTRPRRRKSQSDGAVE